MAHCPSCRRREGKRSGWAISWIVSLVFVEYLDCVHVMSIAIDFFPFPPEQVRMQLAGKAGGGMLTTAQDIIKREGFAGLYSGLSAAIARQMSYTTMRLGFFDEIKAFLAQRQVQENALTRSLSAMTAGACASFLACPVEVCLVRMQADGKLPPEQRRGYKHVGDALLRVAREEGVLTYWRGAGPTVMRAMVVSTTQLGTYDQAKVTFKETGLPDGTSLHLISSLTAGLVYSLASLPLDTAKTRMQSQAAPSTPGGALAYRSTGQTLMKIASEEGVGALWKGFGAYFLRGGGHTVFMFLFYEQYRALARSFYR
ncbi:mitochondrial 2-oxoglutarate malate carrier protein [Nannochloropsis gaditana]|uniref:Mitochondrial 2-oxoglutarate malate carrier protein n=2 Tax=Nannochloropsis gaditana TaxID=72520 RepID=W7TLF9_9STRA|nr:mitochondrial 2-oxoglutarate malate carrier protein [Nannochloropsis gaditana]